MTWHDDSLAMQQGDGVAGYQWVAGCRWVQVSFSGREDSGLAGSPGPRALAEPGGLYLDAQDQPEGMATTHATSVPGLSRGGGRRVSLGTP